MNKTKFYNKDEPTSEKLTSKIVDFLYKYLDRFRDEKDAIRESINYAFSKDAGRGGFVLTSSDEENNLVGVSVVNFTGMKKYIPENILVYIAVNKNKRGQGIGANLIKELISKCQGRIALHVEYDNPAKRLYERIGFKSKYAEMRYKR